ncbi:MAG: metal-dependent transcriptional regulator [Oscillospiraceae bacterium]|jgi:Mn-dependent DtxR family transcriptional regulator|nr:metal-dependent transcriptional regulator [Oscillospiraceae bacterium]
MKIRESAEDYLETILVLSMSGGEVHAIDVARELGFSKASVSVAMKNLRLQGHIAVADDAAITLTDTGAAIAHSVYERHTFLTDWLTSLGVPRATAARDACKIEHVISAETFEALKRLPAT